MTTVRVSVNNFDIVHTSGTDKITIYDKLGKTEKSIATKEHPNWGKIRDHFIQKVTERKLGPNHTITKRTKNNLFIWSRDGRLFRLNLNSDSSPQSLNTTTKFSRNVIKSMVGL